MRNFLRPAAVILFSSVILTGCAAGADDTDGADSAPSPASTPSPAATSSPAPTQVAEVPAVAEPAATAEKVIIATAGVTIQFADGQTQEFDYFEPTAPLVEALTGAFGAEPVVQEITPEEPSAFTSMEWSGFTISDSEVPVEAPYTVEYSVFADVADVAGVVIESKEGAQVGDSALEAVDLYPIGPSDFTNDQGGQGAMFSTDFIELPEGGTDGASGKTFATALTAADLNAGLTSIFAPAPNWLQ
jgi:hypothetical protein